MKKYIIILLFITPLFLLVDIDIFSTNDLTTSEIKNRDFKDRTNIRFEKPRDENSIEELQSMPNKENTAIIASRGLRSFKEMNIDPSLDNNYSDSEKKDTEINDIIHNTGKNEEFSYNHKKPEQYNSESTGKDNASNSSEDNSQGLEEDASKLAGRILLYNDRAMETHIFNSDSAQYYADTINTFAEALDENIKVYSIIAPIQIEFLNDEKFENVSAPQKNTINYVNNFFNDRITAVDAYNTISQNTDKYLYFRTDHHWTALGAYYAYTSFMSTKDEEPIALEEYEVDEIKPFLGTTYSSTLSKKLEGNPDTIFVYKPFIENEYYVYYEEPIKKNVINMSCANNKNKYGVFLGGDSPLGKIVTEIDNGKKIIVIKDSYGNAFVPFLIPHYEEIYIVDPRQYKSNIIELIKENEIQEVLFLNYIHVTGYNGFSDLILKMMK